jgi:hypothetical protein
MADQQERWFTSREDVLALFSVVKTVAAANIQANLTSATIGLSRRLKRLSSQLRLSGSPNAAAGFGGSDDQRSIVAVMNERIHECTPFVRRAPGRALAINHEASLARTQLASRLESERDSRFPHE